MSEYSRAVEKARARAASGPGGADAHTVGGGGYAIGLGDDEQPELDGADADLNQPAHQDFSEVIAEATLGVDGDGDQPGAPPGQQKPKPMQVPDMTTKKFFAKAETVEHGLVFGWGIICKEDGVAYFDVQDDHIPEDAMLDAATDFAEGARIGKEMHAGDAKGQHVFLFPLTTDIAKALGLETKKTGLLLGYKPPPDILAKFKNGTLTGFSIGGERLKDEDA